MKVVKNVAAILLISASIAACKSDNDKTDAADSLAKAKSAVSADSARIDSLNKANLKPADKDTVDTLDARPVH